MFDKIICVLVRIKVRGHFLLSVTQFMLVTVLCICELKRYPFLARHPGLDYCMEIPWVPTLSAYYFLASEYPEKS